MPEKEPINYENLEHLIMEYDDIENLYHMSMRIPSLEVYGLRGEALSILCLDELASLNPEKYQVEYINRAVQIYDEENQDTHLNIMYKSLFRRLNSIFDVGEDNDLLSATPTEFIQDAYFKTLDRRSGGYEDGLKLKANLLKNEFEIDWYESLTYHHDLVYAGHLLIMRGYTVDELVYKDAISFYHTFLEQAAKGASNSKYREEAYLLLKNEYKFGNKKSWMELLDSIDIESMTDLLEEKFESIIGKTTPSVSMDIIAAFLQKNPDDKKYKKLSKQYVRRYSPFPSFDRKNFESLSDLGKKAFFELGGRDPVNELMGMVSLMASEK